MTELFEEIRALRRELLTRRRRAATLRAIATKPRRQTNLNHWADAAARRSDATRRARAAEQRRHAAQARQAARASGPQDPDERERLADLRQSEADQRDRLANQREQQANERERLADERERIANQRDREADRRDLMADKRDAAADRRDQVAFYHSVRPFRLERRLIQPDPLGLTAQASTNGTLTPTTGNGSHPAPATGGADTRVGSGTNIGQVIQLRPRPQRQVGNPSRVER